MVFNYRHPRVLPDLIQFVSSVIKKSYASLLLCLSEMSNIISFNGIFKWEVIFLSILFLIERHSLA